MLRRLVAVLLLGAFSPPAPLLAITTVAGDCEDLLAGAGDWLGGGDEYIVHVDGENPNRVVKIVDLLALEMDPDRTVPVEVAAWARFLRKRALYPALVAAEGNGGLPVARLHALEATHLSQDRLRGFVLARGTVARLPPPLRQRYDRWRAAVGSAMAEARRLSLQAGAAALRDVEATLPRINDLYLQGRLRHEADISDGNLFVVVPGVPGDVREADALHWALANDALGEPSAWRDRVRLIDF